MSGHRTWVIARATCACKGHRLVQVSQLSEVQLPDSGPEQQGVTAGTQDKRQAFTDLVMLSHLRLNKRHKIHPP